MCGSGNIGYTTRRPKHNTICVRYHYTKQTQNNVNKIWALLQTTGGKDVCRHFASPNLEGFQNKLEDTKGVIISRKSNKNDIQRT
jgi:predicted urease superfamily metal-dependent hydrolase